MTHIDKGQRLNNIRDANRCDTQIHTHTHLQTIGNKMFLFFSVSLSLAQVTLGGNAEKLAARQRAGVNRCL